MAFVEEGMEPFSGAARARVTVFIDLICSSSPDETKALIRDIRRKGLRRMTAIITVSTHTRPTCPTSLIFFCIACSLVQPSDCKLLTVTFSFRA